MLTAASLLWNRTKVIFSREEGQDLVEYALVVALIALAATVGMGSLASSLNGAFTSLGTTLTTDI
jgi:pilus assembly protein Flp/PilA